MDSGLVSDYDYTIFDSNGIRIVKNGIEYPITEEEWRKANPEHKDVGCKECIIAQTKEEILRTSKDLAKDRYLGLFALPGFTGHLPFFIFKCEFCNKFFADYPHGDGYVICGYCKESQTIESKSVWRKILKLGIYSDNRPFSFKEIGVVVLSIIFLIFLLPIMLIDMVGDFLKRSKD